MAEDACKNAAWTFLKCPHDWPRGAIHFGGGQHVDLVRIANHRPVGFVKKMNWRRESEHNRMVGWSDDFQIDGCVAVLRTSGIGSQANALRQFLRLRVSDGGRMEDDDTFASGQELIQLLKPLRSP